MRRSSDRSDDSARSGADLTFVTPCRNSSAEKGTPMSGKSRALGRETHRSSVYAYNSAAWDKEVERKVRWKPAALARRRLHLEARRKGPAVFLTPDHTRTGGVAVESKRRRHPLSGRRRRATGAFARDFGPRDLWLTPRSASSISIVFVAERDGLLNALPRRSRTDAWRACRKSKARASDLIVKSLFVDVSCAICVRYGRNGRIASCCWGGEIISGHRQIRSISWPIKTIGATTSTVSRKLPYS